MSYPMKKADIGDSIRQVKAEIAGYTARIEARGFIAPPEPIRDGGAAVTGPPMMSAKDLFVASAYARELMVLAVHLPKCNRHEATLHYNGSPRYFAYVHGTPGERKRMKPSEREAVENSAMRFTLGGEIALLETRLQEAGVDFDSGDGMPQSTEAMGSRYAALAGMLKAAPDGLPAERPKPKATEPAAATPATAKSALAPAKARAMTSAEAMARYNAIHVDDAKARQAFRNQHAALLGIKRG